MSSEASSSDSLSPQDIIFSCAICQTTISELYRRPRTDHGFSSGDGDKERVVTRLWLTECGHLICSTYCTALVVDEIRTGLGEEGLCLKT